MFTLPNAKSTPSCLLEPVPRLFCISGNLHYRLSCCRSVTTGLVAGAGRLLQSKGLLFIYGPFKVDGKFTTDSNKQFHETLIAQNPQWGYRDVAAVAAVAAEAGLDHEQTIPMPANNFALVFRRQ